MTSKCILSSSDSHVYHPMSSPLSNARTQLSSSLCCFRAFHRRCCAHISGESRCLRNHYPLKVLHGIAGQSDFWGASSRDCSSKTVTSSPAYYSPSIPAHRLRPSTSPPVLQQLVRLLPQQYDHLVPRSTTLCSSIDYFLKYERLLQTTRTTTSTTL
jgi:hypothetical protein